MSKTLVPLRHDITAARDWVDDRLTIFDKKRLTPEDLRKDFDSKRSDIETVIEESQYYLIHHNNNDPVLQLSIKQLMKSWCRLCEYYGHDRTSVEPLDLSQIDSLSISSHSSNPNYTSRFESFDSDDGRKYVPRLTNLYRAVIRAKVKHHKRSHSGSEPPSLSVSPNSSFYSSSPAVSPGRSTYTDLHAGRQTLLTTHTTTVRYERTEVTLDLSDSEPEYEDFPWVYVSDEEFDLPERSLNATSMNLDYEAERKNQPKQAHSSKTSQKAHLTDRRYPSTESHRATRLFPPAAASTFSLDSSTGSDSGIFHDSHSSFTPLATSSILGSDAGSMENVSTRSDFQNAEKKEAMPKVIMGNIGSSAGHADLRGEDADVSSSDDETASVYSDCVPFQHYGVNANTDTPLTVQAFDFNTCECSVTPLLESDCVQTTTADLDIQSVIYRPPILGYVQCLSEQISLDSVHLSESPNTTAVTGRDVAISYDSCNFDIEKSHKMSPKVRQTDEDRGDNQEYFKIKDCVPDMRKLHPEKSDPVCERETSNETLTNFPKEKAAHSKMSQPDGQDVKYSTSVRVERSSNRVAEVSDSDGESVTTDRWFDSRSDCTSDHSSGSLHDGKRVGSRSNESLLIHKTMLKNTEDKVQSSSSKSKSEPSNYADNHEQTTSKQASNACKDSNSDTSSLYAALEKKCAFHNLTNIREASADSTKAILLHQENEQTTPEKLSLDQEECDVMVDEGEDNFEKDGAHWLDGEADAADQERSFSHDKITCGQGEWKFNGGMIGDARDGPGLASDFTGQHHDNPNTFQDSEERKSIEEMRKRLGLKEEDDFEQQSDEESSHLKSYQRGSESSTNSFEQLQVKSTSQSSSQGERAASTEQAVQTNSEDTTPRFSKWWCKAALIGLLLSAIFYLLWLMLVPQECDRKCFHCGVFGLRKKYSGLPPH